MGKSKCCACFDAWSGALGAERRHVTPFSPDTPDFERLVGASSWRRLAPEIQRRFSHAIARHETVNYAGMMQDVHCSWPGLVLANLCRFMGTPFAPYRGRDVPVSIRLRRESRGNGIVWEREYHYPGRRSVRVLSVKRMAANGGLLECVGGGFGMRLAVFEEAGALHFLSLRYFWRLGRWLVPLPHVLSPGEAHVVHSEIGGGRFRFEMTIRHRWLGVLFHQDGVFEGEGGA